MRPNHHNHRQRGKERKKEKRENGEPHWRSHATPGGTQSRNWPTNHRTDILGTGPTGPELWPEQNQRSQKDEGRPNGPRLQPNATAGKHKKTGYHRSTTNQRAEPTQTDELPKTCPKQSRVDGKPRETENQPQDSWQTTDSQTRRPHSQRDLHRSMDHMPLPKPQCQQEDVRRETYAPTGRVTRPGWQWPKPEWEGRSTRITEALGK